MPDMQFIVALQKLAFIFGLAVGLAIIVAAIALCLIARNTASIRDDLLNLRIQAEMDSDRRNKQKSH